MKPGPQDIELWHGGEMIGRGAATLAHLPDTTAQREAADRMFRIAAQAVEAEQRRADAIAARDAARADAARARDEAHDFQVRQLVGSIDSLSRRMDAMEEKQRNAEAMEKAQRIRDALDDLNHRQDDGPTHIPGGELHEVGPTETTAHAVLAEDRR